MKVDSAWSVMAGAGLCMFAGQAATVLFTFGVFAPEISADTGWPRSFVAGAIAPATIAAALLSPVAGRLADTYGARKVAMIGGPAYAAGLMLLGFGADRPAVFVALLALACALGFAATPVVYAKLATAWFVRRRGLALSLMFSCTSLGVAFWPPIAARLITALGWRNAYAAIGIAAGSLILVSAVLLLRDPPRGAKPLDALEGPCAATADSSLRDALRRLTFWRLVAVFVCLTAALTAVTVNLPLILRTQGMTALESASVLTVVGLAMFVGRLSAGIMLDRWSPRLVTVGFMLLPLVALIVLVMTTDRAALYLAAALLGLGLGSEMDAAAYLVSRAFGVRSFGEIYGAVTLAYGISSALGPAVAGIALAHQVADAVVYLCCIAGIVPAIVLLLTTNEHELCFGTANATSG